MLGDILKEVVSITVGKGFEPIADLLNSKRYVNEFIIAKKLEITINQTRNILYKISDYGLVSNERKKDKKKGWYTYYWKFETLKCLEFLKKRILARKAQFMAQINRREEKNYYVCESCNIECSEDEALLQDFTCDECGELFTRKDNTQLLKGLNRNLEKLDEKLEAIEVEIVIERAKLDKKKRAWLRREEKEKLLKKEEAKRKRAEKRAERDALKAKLKKEQGDIEPKKKAVKKKVIKKKIVKKPVKKKAVSKKTVVKPKKKIVKKKVKKKPVKKKPVKKKPIKKKSLPGRKVVKRKR